MIGPSFVFTSGSAPVAPASLSFGVTNLYAEMAPMSGWPTRARDADYAATGTWELASYDYCYETRNYPCRTNDANPLQLFDSLSVQWTATGTTVSGWLVSRHSHVVDGTEDFFEVRHDGTVYALARPWRGYFGLVDTAATTSGGVSYDVSDGIRHVRAWINSSGEVVLGTASNNPLPLAFAERVILTGVATGVCVRWNKHSRGQEALVLRASSGLVVLYRTGAAENTAALVGIVGSGSSPTMCSLPGGGTALFWRDGGAVKCTVYDVRLGTVRSVATIVASGVDDTGTAAYAYPTAEGFTVVVLYSDTGTLKRKVSVDGCASFGSASSIETGAYPAASRSKGNRLLECWVSAGKVRGRTLDVQENVVNAVSDWVASGVDDAQIAVDASPGALGQDRAVLFYSSSGSIAQVHSFDGVTWS